jgi:hypothetical protein
MAPVATLIDVVIFDIGGDGLIIVVVKQGSVIVITKVDSAN